MVGNLFKNMNANTKILANIQSLLQQKRQLGFFATISHFKLTSSMSGEETSSLSSNTHQREMAFSYGNLKRPLNIIKKHKNYMCTCGKLTFYNKLQDYQILTRSCRSGFYLFFLTFLRCTIPSFFSFI